MTFWRHHAFDTGADSNIGLKTNNPVTYGNVRQPGNPDETFLLLFTLSDDSLILQIPLAFFASLYVYFAKPLYLLDETLVSHLRDFGNSVIS